MFQERAVASVRLRAHRGETQPGRAPEEERGAAAATKRCEDGFAFSQGYRLLGTLGAREITLLRIVSSQHIGSR